MAPAILSFYRADQSRTMRRVLIAGASLVSLGSVVMVVSFLTRQSNDVRVAAACIGIACVVAGGLTTVLGMQRALADDACIVVRNDGLAVHLRGVETFVAWDDIEAVRFEQRAPARGSPEIVIARRDGGEVRIGDRSFGGKGGHAMAGELDGLRRKASFDLLPS